MAGSTFVYLVFAFDLCTKAKWPLGRMAWVLLAGTVPTAAFFGSAGSPVSSPPKVITADEPEPVQGLRPGSLTR